MPERHALLLGVDRYPFAGVGDLRGCANDVELMSCLLRERFGFPAENVRILLNEDATHDAVRDALTDLAAVATRDDEVVLYFAGLGSRIHGGGLTLVPGDSGRGRHPNRDVPARRVDEMVRALNENGVRPTLVFDCSHSSSAVRDPFAEAPRNLPPDPRPRDVDLGVDFNASRWLHPERRARVLTACAAYEQASEHRVEGKTLGDLDVRHGVLTFFFAQALLRAETPDWRAVLYLLFLRLHTRYRRQHPQFVGPAYEPVFGGPRPSRSGTPATGLLRAFTAGRGSLPNPRLRVALAGAGGRPGEADLVVSAIARSPLLETVHEGAADVLLRLLHPRGKVADGTPCPRLGRLDAWTWACIGRDGHLVCPVREAGTGAAATLLADLENLSRYRHLLALENPDPASPLAGRVSLSLRRDDGFEGEPGLVDFVEGEWAEVRIDNRSETRIWVSLVKLGPGGEIELLLPKVGHPKYQPGGCPIDAGDSLSLSEYYFDDPRLGGGGLEVQFREALPALMEDREGDTSLLYLKLLATTMPSDFDFLVLDSTPADDSHPLEAIVASYTLGAGLFVSPAAVPPESDWIVVTAAARVRRATNPEILE